MIKNYEIINNKNVCKTPYVAKIVQLDQRSFGNIN